MLDLDTLNPEQRDAVTSTQGPMMILAGAGTGKTRVITYRIAYMLDSGIRPESIVALSFTNKAAKEMTERVKAIVGSSRAKQVWLGTFHSFCLNILRRHAHAAGLVPGFGLAGTADQLELVRKGLEEKGWAGLYQADKMHFQIGVAKNHLLSPDDLRNGLGRTLAGVQADPAVVASVFELYERQLKLNRVIDFDDCIYKTVRLLRSDEAVRQSLRRQFQHLMVDEYQDTNSAQLAVMELLASDQHDVCVVGDDDQSIYSWRGAMYEVLERFETMFPGTKVVKLEQNYRCSNVILVAANTVIKNNTKRKDKTLWSASTETAPIVLTPCEDERAESHLIAEKCMTLMGGGMSPSQICVLYRANALAKSLELALKEARIPYKTFGGQSFFERKEVKDFVSYLRLILDDDDRLALWRVVNTPNRGIGMKTLERIEAASLARACSPFEALRDAGVASAACERFAVLIDELKAMPRNDAAEFEALGNAIIRQTGLDAEIRAKTDDAGSRERKLSNLRGLPAWIKSMVADRIEEDGFLDQQALLDRLTLDNDRPGDKDKNVAAVSLMTMHAAKGLEFPVVFVVGLEEELLPHKNSINDPNSICEERRLFYVALTRAKQRLFLSHCIERNGGFAGRLERKPSRFLAEMPVQTFQNDLAASTPEKRANAEADRRAQTAKRLGSLRDSLGLSKGR